MKILITGATGFIGTHLIHKLLEKNFTINVLTRNAQSAKQHFPQDNVRAFDWPDYHQSPPAESLEGIQGVIHLMGENIAAKRWTAEQKKILRDSRVESLQSLNRALSGRSLDFLISASAIGLYPVNASQSLDENASPGKGFLPELCKEWEKTAFESSHYKRVVAIRTGVVLGKDGGALGKMLTPFKLGLGGPIGDGYQKMSWIHIDDLTDLYVKAVLDQTMSGPYNAVAPEAVDNFTFTKAFGHALHRPTLFPIPETALKVMFGEMSTVMIDSQWVVPKRISETDFHFKHTNINEALDDLFQSGRS